LKKTQKANAAFAADPRSFCDPRLPWRPRGGGKLMILAAG
jgi:hypothetical protein